MSLLSHKDDEEQKREGNGGRGCIGEVRCAKIFLSMREGQIERFSKIIKKNSKVELIMKVSNIQTQSQ